MNEGVAVLVLGLDCEDESVKLTGRYANQIKGRCNRGAGRAKNQDALGVHIHETLGHTVLCIADGLGAYQYSEKASHRAVKEIGRHWANQKSILDLCLIFHDEIQKQYPLTPNYRKAFVKRLRGEEMPSLKRSPDEGATTFVGACIQGNKATVANIGDSRLYIIRDGELIYQTIDQSMRQFLRLSGQWDPIDSPRNPAVHVLLNALGAPDKTYQFVLDDTIIDCQTGAPLIDEVTLQKEDLIIIATDGLYSNIDSRFIESLSKIDDLEEMEAYLYKKISTILKNKKRPDGRVATLDNYTYILYRH